jgi:transcriptional regulator with XRE-family HTH domain
MRCQPVQGGVCVEAGVRRCSVRPFGGTEYLLRRPALYVFFGRKGIANKGASRYLSTMDLGALGYLLRNAREASGESRAALAARCGVSVRLVAELERGERPNVSFDTALRLMTAVGITAAFEAPGSGSWHAEDATAAAEARARHRRRTWTGRIARLDMADLAPDLSGGSMAEGMARTARVSAELSGLAPTE